MAKFYSINSREGALDNFCIGDYLEIDLGDVGLDGIFAGLERKEISKGVGTIRWYILLGTYRRNGALKVVDRIAPSDYPEMKIRRSPLL